MLSKNQEKLEFGLRPPPLALIAYPISLQVEEKNVSKSIDSTHTGNTCNLCRTKFTRKLPSTYVQKASE